jgi:hypothetical protein
MGGESLCFLAQQMLYDVIKIKNSFSISFKFVEIPNSKELISILLLINCKRLISAASFSSKRVSFGLQIYPSKNYF